MTYLAWPVARLGEFRQDVGGNFLRALAAVGLGGRIRSGRRAERFRGTPELPSYFRQPHGPAGRSSATPGCSWTRSPGRASATRSATPNCWPTLFQALSQPAGHLPESAAPSAT